MKKETMQEQAHAFLVNLQVESAEYCAKLLEDINTFKETTDRFTKAESRLHKERRNEAIIEYLINLVKGDKENGI